MDSKKWHIEVVDADTYESKADGYIRSIYNSAKFNRLNEKKVDKVWYLLIYKGESLRFASIFGEINKKIQCPFSAPFGYPEVIKKGMGIEDYYIAYNLARDLFISNGITKAEIYMPPDFYDRDVIVGWNNVFFQNGFEVSCVDINYTFFDIQNMLSEYHNIIHHNARKNLKVAEKNKCEFEVVDDLEKRHIAYEIIQTNRRERNHPLHMTEEELQLTVPVVGGEWFLVSCESVPIAAALAYGVTKEIIQIIYWGDLPIYANKRPTNFISYKLLQYYSDRGYKHIDVGISTENGVPNYGLCDFKESIGCGRTIKMKLQKEG